MARRYVRNAIAGIVACASVMSFAPAATAQPHDETGTSNNETYLWNEFGSRVTLYVPGDTVEVPNYSTFTMYCWFEHILGRQFYGEVTNGPYVGRKGDVYAVYVVHQTTVPRCE